ncbi:hypothetical protein EX30DRAFT_203075 [Ascodesmis nigricans]|uniref:Uncharacterized protein n=1 Tax=Ascodesmis nigricans TaxID=341454 RepID=A0A4V3SHS7_9PEZI|nr:hypothetical protein EX30DRAFT_203075 [Ascodesmis nigricans]
MSLCTGLGARAPSGPGLPIFSLTTPVIRFSLRNGHTETPRLRSSMPTNRGRLHAPLTPVSKSVLEKVDFGPSWVADTGLSQPEIRYRQDNLTYQYLPPLRIKCRSIFTTPGMSSLAIGRTRHGKRRYHPVQSINRQAQQVLNSPHRQKKTVSGIW